MAVSLITTLSAQIKYPKTPKGTQSDNYHGTRVDDPYRWLENDNSDSTKAWVTEENRVTAAYLSEIPFRDSLRARMAAVYDYERFSVPWVNTGYIYYFKNDGLQNQAALFRQKGFAGKPELVIDPNRLSPDGTVQLTQFTLSADGRYAAWGKSAGGSDWHTYHVMDMSTGQTLPDSVQWVKASGVSWQRHGFYYSRYPQPQPGSELSSKNENHQVWYHRVGTSQRQDTLIYEDTLNLQRFNLASVSDNERYLFLTIDDRGKGLNGNALLFRDEQSPDKAFHPIVPAVGDFLYELVEVTPDNKFLIKTNDHAPNSKIVLVDPARPQQAHWQTLVPEKEQPLETARYAGGKLFLTYLKDVSSEILVFSPTGQALGRVGLPGLGTAAGFSGHNQASDVFYAFTSFNFPTRIYRYETASGKTSLFKKPALDFDPDKYTTEQQFYPSKDGTRVPIFIVHRKGLVMDGSNPTLLYAYGGFNVTISPAFNASLVPWLEQGGVYAVANIRGGSEYGEKWHEAGMLEKKQNVFDDFIAAAEYLIRTKVTSPAKLAIRGGSNGGLLVGAVINQHPELFRVAIPEVGVMDMLRFHKFTIGWNWQPEYGSSDKEKDFAFLYAYSPLHNIRPGVQYPATLVLTADHDDRVVPAHSFKYIATLQEKYAGPNPVLVRIDTNSGHGASSTLKYIQLNADVFSFILFNMGVAWKAH